MALITQFYCSACRQSVHEVKQLNSNLCSECRAKLRESMKKRYLERKRELTLEQRIEEIEEWLYNHSKAPHPISQIF